MTVNKAIEAFKRSNIDIDESWLIVPLVNNELCQDFILFSGTCKEYDMYTVSKIQKERSDDITYVHLDQSLKL